jgi:NAD(P)-dependent dehydrogenase (short-subunit alcohol dehydrogenase family)
MAHELRPALKRAAPSRIVNVGSRYGGVQIDFDDLMVKTRKWSYLKAVPPTMVMRVLLTQDLAEKLKGDGIVVNSVHPGLVRGTQLLKEVGGIFKLLVALFGKSPAKGADTVVWLATAPEAAAETGKLWSKRKPLPTPGQGSDPAARKRLYDEAVRLTGASF